MADTLVVNEIYLSLQGESTFAGLPCIFIRLTGCDLRCSFCDTAYAFTEGRKWSMDEILHQINKLTIPYTPSNGGQQLPLIELTGGEPLLQRSVHLLMRKLCDQGFMILIETSGAHDISEIDPRVHRIMDLKCPSSGEVVQNHLKNVEHLKPGDEVKFVIGTEEDYIWAKERIQEFKLNEVCEVLFSWVAPLQPDQRSPKLKSIPKGQTPISRKHLVERITQDALPVRFQLQMHKFIWPPSERGV